MRPIGKYSGISRVEERSRPSAGAGSRENSADFRLFINPLGREGIVPAADPHRFVAGLPASSCCTGVRPQDVREITSPATLPHTADGLPTEALARNGGGGLLFRVFDPASQQA